MQILGLVAVFNQEKWEKTVDQVDEETKHQIISIMDSMIEDIRSKLEAALKSKEGKSAPENQDFVKLLEQIDVYETMIQKNKKELGDLKK